MEYPFALKNAVETLVAGMKQSELKTCAEKISLRYRQESRDGGRLVTKTQESAVYAACRMPATFGAATMVLEQLAKGKKFHPKTLLDIGAGTGTAAWAAASFFDFEKITCLEREESMRETGQKLMQGQSDFFKTQPVWKSFDLTAGGITEKADLVTAFYVLNELTEADREQALSLLWQSAGQALVLIEPGTPAGFLQMKQHRDFLIKNGAFIAAPCPHQTACRDNWCHFGCRVARSKLHRFLKNGEAPFEDEKFCYLIATRQKHPSPAARILRTPFVEKGKITLTLCTPDGLQTKIVTKKDAAAFKQARKADWGDAI